MGVLGNGAPPGLDAHDTVPGALVSRSTQANRAGSLGPVSACGKNRPPITNVWPGYSTSGARPRSSSSRNMSPSCWIRKLNSSAWRPPRTALVNRIGTLPVLRTAPYWAGSSERAPRMASSKRRCCTARRVSADAALRTTPPNAGQPTAKRFPPLLTGGETEIPAPRSHVTSWPSYSRPLTSTSSSRISPFGSKTNCPRDRKAMSASIGCAKWSNTACGKRDGSAGSRGQRIQP